MYSNKENINILTSLLVAHGITKVVACPGSRNAPVVHNINECPDIELFPVTDERSAGFMALGMSLADDRPAAVCVTSGSALLNLAPAVAEASLRHRSFIVISADRPAAWIGQMDGQTMEQPDVFGSLVSKSVSLPEPKDQEERWYCNRLVNEALIAAKTDGAKPVHINVPVSEPLFVFDVEKLPEERVITSIRARLDTETVRNIVARSMSQASRPMIVLGQTAKPDAETESLIKALSAEYTLLAEPLSTDFPVAFDNVLASIFDDDRYCPDFLLYMGGTVVSKKLKQYLRRKGIKEVWAVSEDGEIHDTFMCQTGCIEGNIKDVLNTLAAAFKDMSITGSAAKQEERRSFRALWKALLTDSDNQKTPDHYAPLSELAVQTFEQSLEDMDYTYHIHYANSTSIRLACKYASHYVWCNRGINGIDGCLSTAAGFSLATEDMVFCVIGDLSFFYDQNALWNTNLKGNLRIILLNNRCGGIFYGLDGIRESAACDKFIAGSHNTDARGICTQNDIGYLSATNTEELYIGLATLMTSNSQRPMLLEVFDK
ncbi:MAG: 2-succinyl-5-enolpyruvyl-6-hydroxy-3-cyclohexene-1-carboxylic-acid synthase [Prevotella sp.]